MRACLSLGSAPARRLECPRSTPCTSETHADSLRRARSKVTGGRGCPGSRVFPTMRRCQADPVSVARLIRGPDAGHPGSQLMSRRTGRTIPTTPNTPAHAIKVTAPMPGETRCWTRRPISASEARSGMNRPTEGARPNRRLSTARPQASSAMIAPTWLWMIAPRPAPIAPPQGRPDQPTERQQQNVAAAEHHGDAALLKDRVADRPADPVRPGWKSVVSSTAPMRTAGRGNSAYR
jgi:hypothetical protein